MVAPDAEPARRLPKRAWVLIVVIVVLVAALIALAVLWPRPAATTADPIPTPTPVVTPTPTPEPTGAPENTESYDLSALPEVNVFAVVPELPVDDAPEAAFTGETVRAAADAVPVWADPLGEPVAWLAQEYRYGGTTVPVIERQDHWVRVLLTGRQAMPSAGDPGQLTGWLRIADVDVARSEVTVEVDLSERTVDIVRDGEVERIATGFAWGTEATPTPIGRSFIHLSEVTSFSYARGHPMVYLSLQSPTLDGFGGQDVAVTAFHYHDARSGAISNGCLRMDAEAITKLGELPVGTGVLIRA